MIGFIATALGVRRGIAWLITLGGAAALIAAAGFAFNHWLDRIRADAMAEQKAADTIAFMDAQIKAERAQAAKVDQARADGIRIGKELANDYAETGSRIDAAAAALGRLWQAETRPGAGRADGGAATGISDATPGTAAAAQCAAAGWVFLPVAIQLAAGADREAARGDALSAFLTQNAAGWPK